MMMNEHDDIHFNNNALSLPVAAVYESEQNYKALVRQAFLIAFDLRNDFLVHTMFKVCKIEDDQAHSRHTQASKNVWQSVHTWSGRIVYFGEEDSPADSISIAVRYLFFVEQLTDVEQAWRDEFWGNLRATYVTADHYIARLSRLLFVDAMDLRMLAIKQSPVWKETVPIPFDPCVFVQQIEKPPNSEGCE